MKKRFEKKCDDTNVMTRITTTQAVRLTDTFSYEIMSKTNTKKQKHRLWGTVSASRIGGHVFHQIYINIYVSFFLDFFILFFCYPPWYMNYITINISSGIAKKVHIPLEIWTFIFFSTMTKRMTHTYCILYSYNIFSVCISNVQSRKWKSAISTLHHTDTQSGCTLTRKLWSHCGTRES